MLNLIKMDIRRFFRSKSLYIIIAICMALCLFNTISMEKMNMTLGIGVQVEVKNLSNMDDLSNIIPKIEKTVAYQFENACKGAHISLLVSIFTTIFVMAEQKNGFLKNIAGQKKFRGSIIISKMVISALFIAILFAVNIGFTSILQAIVFGNNFDTGFNSEFFRNAGLQYLAHFALSILVILLCTWTRSSSLTMTLSTLLSINVFSIIYILINIIISKLDIKDFDISKYTIMNCIQSTTGTMVAEDVTRIIVVSLIYTAIYGFLSVLLMQKRDVK